MGILSHYIYDSPDGDDCLKKTAYSTRTGALVGAYISLYDIIGRTHPKGVAAITARLLHYTLPAAAGAAVFASTGCLVGSMRGKDTPLNHAIAGLAAGGIWGAKMKSIPVAVVSGTVFAIVAACYKAGLKDGFDMVLVGDGQPVAKFGTLGHHERFYIKPKPYVEEPKNY